MWDWAVTVLPLCVASEHCCTWTSYLTTSYYTAPSMKKRTGIYLSFTVCACHSNICLAGGRKWLCLKGQWYLITPIRISPSGTWKRSTDQCSPLKVWGKSRTHKERPAGCASGCVTLTRSPSCFRGAMASRLQGCLGSPVRAIPKFWDVPASVTSTRILETNASTWGSLSGVTFF